MIKTNEARRNKGKYMILIGLIAATTLSAQTTGYTITTVVGNGTSGYIDGVAPINAQVFNPNSVTVDSSGNLYIADSGNNRIRKVANGTITTVAGNGTAGFSGDTTPATSASLNAPAAVAVDNSGNLYIADTNNHLIRKVTTDGKINTFAGNAQAGPGYLDAAIAINGQFFFPSGITVDSSGNVYVSDNGNNRIRKITASGVLTTVAGNGVVGSSGDGLSALTAHLNGPIGIVVDKGGNLYFADSNNHKIRKVSATGIISLVAGTGFTGFSGDNSLAINAQLATPPGVAVDGAGNVYIADKLNSRIRMVTAGGIITTIAGKQPSGYSGDQGPATSAQLKLPQGVAVDGQGNVYVADTQNSAIRLLTPAGTGGGTPAINPNGVVSAAAFGGFPSIAPGSWIEIYGTNLAADTREWGSADFVNNTAPISLDRTAVSIGSQFAFVRYISPGQVNVQVPSNVQTGTQPLVVSTASGGSAVYNITVNATQPGMLAPANFLIGGKQYAVGLFNDGVTYVLPTNAIPGLPSRPAKPGETITFYGIGFGPVTPGSIVAGQIVQAVNSLTLPLQIQIGNLPAPVTYSGLAPSYVGLYQFNVVVPTVGDSDAAPLTFTLGTNAPQTLYTAVKN